ncbi:efflux RND transporter periplasmic adaptor subunit [Marinobacter sp. MDS2]|uniref:efflux RND transporter periplasmic adaptor subunit n=1 Tax=Marinobacter sp. MDS2 TaxID=3065961 RepID=UPI00273AAB04|nr:efflux RND transporter periplasmic adaptor subunit [Marinobacter sp. MDS2]MDP4549222.1 efflux RND transporter periplasmic adaptor subunit [Marinobacter sp. MDS2]
MRMKTRTSLTLILMVLFVGHAQSEEHLMGEMDVKIPVQDCVMEPSEIVDVGSVVPGVVDAIHVYRSDLIKKGAVIVELESSVEQASLELARARANQNTAIELREESARFGTLTQNREQALLRKSAISQHDWDKTKTEARIAELQVKQEQDNKAIYELEYRRAQLVLEQRRIRSPVDGVVMERFKSVGEFVEDEPVARVAQLNPLHVEVIVPVDYLGSIVPGMQADVRTGLANSGEYRATVERVDRVADAASGTYGVRLSLPNPDYTIPAGLRCQLTFLPQTQQKPQTVAVQSDAATAMETADEAPLGRCYSVGPVEDKSTAEQLADKLQQQSESLLLRAVSESVEVGYRVLAAEPFNSVEKKQLLARLDEAGITDRFVLAQGESKGRIALGYFRKPYFANKRQESLAQKGFVTEILPHRKDIEQYWLDVALTSELDSPDQIEQIAATLSTAPTLKPMACYPELARR